MLKPSPRETFDRHLQNLLDDVLLLGSMVEQAVREAVDTLKNQDIETAHQVYRNDDKINEKRYAIENDCLTLIATQQPMARDLRLLAAVLEIITELERIGDYAKGICRITIFLGEEPLPISTADLEMMADIGLSMLRRSLGAFVARDTETARQIPLEDNQVDDLYNRVYRDLMSRMIADPTTVDRTNYLVWAAHNLERMADRVTNICERIIFVTTGEMREMDSTDDEAIDRRHI